MLDNLLVNLKNHANNLGDSLKSKSRKISSNFNAFKYHIRNKSRSTYYTIARKEENEYYNDYLSPRAYSMTTFSVNDSYNISYQNEWFPIPLSLEDNNSIVDRFIKVISVNDTNEVGYLVNSLGNVNFIISFYYREEQTGKRSGGGLQWVLKMIITLIVLEENQVFKLDYRVVGHIF